MPGMYSILPEPAILNLNIKLEVNYSSRLQHVLLFSLSKNLWAMDDIGGKGRGGGVYDIIIHVQ